MHSVEYGNNGEIVIRLEEQMHTARAQVHAVSWNILDTQNKKKSTAKQLKWWRKKEKPTKKIEVLEMQSEQLSSSNVSAGIFRRISTILAQPIFIPHKRKRIVKTNRVALFFSDVLRFGCTFTAIFGLLFVGLNYESFWAIASDQINPVASIQKKQQLRAHADKVLANAPSSNQVGIEGVNLISKLPMVGPETNQLIIPKLGLSSPITTPEYEALLREDWTQLEKDIQAALEHGVVHYPGTAVAGQPGNFFITGHSSYYAWAPGKYKSIFAKLHMLEIGDEYYVYYNGDKHKYIVDSKTEVLPSNVHVLDQPLDRRMSTLMTCTPVGTTLRRLVLTAQEVDPNTNQPIVVTDAPAEKKATAKPAQLPF